MASTSDWVTQQTGQDQTKASKAVSSDLPVTPPPRKTNHEVLDAARRSREADMSTAQNIRKQRYEIQTLLEMRHLKGVVPVMLRVKPEAIAENIFQYLGATYSRHHPIRCRGLSDISNASRGSINSNNNLYNHLSQGTRSAALPRLQRLAPAPINISLAQRQDGFVRFLQEHASPPHHRVTAGGRIVPAGPTSPPPMLDYGSLTGLVRGRRMTAKASQNQEGPLNSAAESQNIPGGAESSMTNRGYPPYQSNGVSHQFCSAPIQRDSSYDDSGYGNQLGITPVMQGSAAMVPMGAFPDGSTMLAYNGVTYRAYWNGLSTIIEPLQPLSTPADQQCSTASYVQTQNNISQYDHPLQGTQAPDVTFSSVNTTNSYCRSTRKTSDSKPNHASVDEAADLKMQLTNLDKHLALYHFDITPAERAGLVAQRRYLVEAIDRIRVSKGTSKPSAPLIAPTLDVPITPLPTSNSDYLQNKGRSSYLHGTALRDHKRGKGLSPAAVPFVPSKIRKTSSETSTRHNLNIFANAALSRKEKALGAYDPSGSTQVTSHREESTSSVLDPSDPAMRVIDYQDIEYAGRYLYNWELEKKTYCTTVAEFQEAIRQVREQARRYGCLGGQSKDPAYDAEQDLWWAICDRDPIPLPAKVPDHVSNPRSWNWEDSIFNFRVKGDSLPGRGIENARSSPRLMGWDPVTTEHMKDRVDVSRSYYAYKGQLPSVPFRTWAYDHKGNKVAIESNLQSPVKCGPQACYTTLNQSPSSVTGHNTSSAATVPSRALRTLSTNELNARVIDPGTGPQSKDLQSLDATHRSPDHKPILKTAATMQPSANSDSGFVRNLKSYLGKFVNDKEKSRSLGQHSHSRQSLTENRQSPIVSQRPSQEREETPTHSPDTKKTSAIVDSTHDPLVPRDSPTIERSLGLTCESKNSIHHSRIAEREIIRSPSLSDQSVETRSQWGPEEGAGFAGPKATFGYQGEHDHSAEKAKKVRVNIPLMTPSVPSTNPPETIDKDEGVTKQSLETTTAQNFLRRMLQNPTYTPVRTPTAEGSSMASRLSKLLRGGSGSTSSNQHKENDLIKDNIRLTGNGLRDRKSHMLFVSALKSDPNISVTKAHTSLRPTCNQSRASLSYIDVIAGDEAATQSCDHHGESKSQQAQISSTLSTVQESLQINPMLSTYQSRGCQNIPEAMAAHHTSVHFGLDGGADSIPPQIQKDSEPNSQKKADFDYQGVTLADFEIKREDPNNTWHKGAVDDFFAELAAKERREVMASQQSSTTKSA